MDDERIETRWFTPKEIAQMIQRGKHRVMRTRP